MQRVHFDKNKYFLIAILLIVLIYISVARYKENSNYYNSDATWHTLLTLKCYEETSSDVHKYLPIVSLGETDDKGIPWGVTVPDDKGNYYYTSFSPAGYVFPYIFMKFFHLPISEKSLYIFNTMLFIISGILWMYFIKVVFSNSKHVYVLSFMAFITYVSSPEILHSQGMVYWHQSIMQVSLILQLWMYYNMCTKKTRWATIFFYMLCVLNPYIEWTGYVANVGFALVEFFRNCNNRKKGFVKLCSIALLTMLSFLIFIGHYLLVIDMNAFFNALLARFTARNVSVSIGWLSMVNGYLKSFKYCWILVIVVVAWDIIKNKRILINNKFLLILLAFPLIENVIMKQHAYEYSFDRMKMIYVLSFLICMCANNLLNSSKSDIIKKSLIVLTVMIGILNFNSYLNDNTYIWDADYRNSNKRIAAYINEHYDDAIISIENGGVRGYLNMLFERGIYEWVSLSQAIGIAEEKSKPYAITIKVQENSWDMSEVERVIVYNLSNDDMLTISFDGKRMEIVENAVKDTYMLANLTDENWTNGYSNYQNILLFERIDELLLSLQVRQQFICNGKEYHIESVDYDDKWIRVTVDGEISECMYSQSVTFIE